VVGFPAAASICALRPFNLDDAVAGRWKVYPKA
jgi:hypothetical protein